MKTLLSRFAPAIGLAVLCLLLAVLTPAFATPSNLANVLLQSAINAVLAVGQTLVILTAGIDLSVGSVLALAGMILGQMLHAGTGAPLATAGALALAAACGYANGALITRGGLPPFIATLGTMSACRGLALVVSGGRPISGFTSGFLAIAHGGFLVGIMAAVYLAAWFVLARTAFGRAVYAVGGNERAAWLAGIRTGRVVTVVYALSGLLAGLAAVTLTARLDSAQPIAGFNYELDAIAAVVIGGTSLAGGEGGVLGTLVGALIMGVLRNGLNLLAVSADMQQVIIGAVIILAVLVDRSRHGLARWLGDAPARPRLVGALAVGALVLLLGGAWMGRSARTTGPTLALVLKTLNNPYWVDVAQAAQQAADAAHVKLVVEAPDRETDVERQMQIVENLIQARVSAILLAPSGSKEIVPGIRKANDAGIPVLIVDTRVDMPTLKAAGGHVAGFIGSDNRLGGRLAGAGLATALGGTGNVLLIEGIAGHETGDARKRGFLEAMQAYPGMKVVASLTAQWEEEKAFNVTQNVLQAHPELNGIFACNDVMAMGALRALQSAGRADVKLVGFDASADARKAIAAGGMLGSVAQYPREMGRIAVEQALALLRGEKIPAETPTKVDVVTRVKRP